MMSGQAIDDLQTAFDASLTDHVPDVSLSRAEPTPLPYPNDQGELLERVRENVLRFLAEAPSPPRAVRVRVGDVSVEAEWSDNREVAAPAPPAAASDAAPVAGIAARSGPEQHHITADAVGVFYHSPEPGAAPFVVVGDIVVVGQKVGLIEAMKVMIPVTATVAGRVIAVLPGNGDPVEYGEELITLTPLDEEP